MITYDLSAAWREFLNRGVTYRVFPGGKRALIHRWPVEKIRGAIPLSVVLIGSIYDTSPIMRRLIAKR